MRNTIQTLLIIVALILTQQSAPKAPITLPLETTSYGGIFLEAHINNSPPMSFYLDSGASLPFIINSKKAAQLNLNSLGQITQAEGAGPNTYEASFSEHVTVDLSTHKFTDQRVALMNLGVVEEQLGRSLDGLIGMGLFLRYVVEIDYSAKILRLYDPQSYVYSGAGESVPLTLHEGHFFIPASIKIPQRGEFAGQFLVDTGGCLLTAILTTSFAEINKLPVPGAKNIVDESVTGLGGNTRLLVTRASEFKIGKSIFTTPLIFVSQDKAGALASSGYEGLIGSEILRRFKVTFDYSRRRLILERNSDFQKPMEYDMSGMSVRAYGDDFRTFSVYQVLDDSPAKEAGLRAGDIIERIDATPASQLTLEQILNLMKVQGREYRLTIKRGADSRSVQLRTRRLI